MNASPRKSLVSENDPNESADRLTSILATQADQWKALLVAIRATAPPKISTYARREDASNTAVGVSFFYHMEMHENLFIKSVYMENQTGSILYAYPSVATQGTPVLVVNPGTYRRIPLNVALKEITIVGTGSGSAQSTPLQVIVTNALWEPVIGSIV